MSTPYRLSRSIALLLMLAGLLSTVGGRAQAAPAGQTTSSVSIQGTINVRPRYRVVQQHVRPRAYLVILDASKSMSWTWAGQGTKDGVDVQCGPTSDPAVQRKHCGASAAWRVVQERRVYDVKTALQPLIDQLNPNDTMRLLSFNTQKIKANKRWTLGDEAGKATLRQDLLKLGQYQDDPYRTAGEAPSASALYQARQLLDEQPQTAPDGQHYGAPTVILLTDSVANSFLVGNGDWDYNEATDICPNVPFPEDQASCHVGYAGSVPRPITAMNLQASLLQQRNPTIYVVALAGVDETGLREVASTPNFPFFSRAGDPTELENSISEIISDTQAVVEFGPCEPHGGDTWVNTIDDAHQPDPVPPYTSPNDPSTVGYVYLYDQQGNLLTGPQGQTPIRRDMQTGALAYTISDLAPGTYQMRAFVFYKGDDGITRTYSLLFDPATESDSQFIVFTLEPQNGGPVPMNRFLDLNGSVCST